MRCIELVHKPANAQIIAKLEVYIVDEPVDIGCGNTFRWSHVPHICRVRTKSFLSFTDTNHQSHHTINAGPVLKWSTY